MLTRNIILIAIFVAALAALQGGHLDDLRRAAESLTPWSWNPDATLLGLYTMVVIGVSSGSTRARVQLDLSTVKKERIDEMAEAFEDINKLAFDRVSGKLHAVRNLMGAVDAVAESTGKTAALLNARLSALGGTAAAHDTEEVRAGIEKLAGLSDLLRGVTDIRVPDIGPQLDDLREHLDAVHSLAEDYDIDDTVKEIEGVTELGRELGTLARMFSGTEEKAAEEA
jgi:hypothetical protein